MNIFNNKYNNENEKEDDWGWFIRLDLDTTTSTVQTTTYKKVNHICKSLQTIEENQEYYEPINNNNTKSIKLNTKKTKYDFFKNLLFYGLFYNYIYLDYGYKCINLFSCYKHKTCN
uniref:Uncharacterized protein n=1 Tax=viral metagenome TaxID=1070528 RepID=A0A6C0DLB1_9ZZZZ